MRFLRHIPNYLLLKTINKGFVFLSPKLKITRILRHNIVTWDRTHLWFPQWVCLYIFDKISDLTVIVAKKNERMRIYFKLKSDVLTAVAVVVPWTCGIDAWRGKNTPGHPRPIRSRCLKYLLSVADNSSVWLVRTPCTSHTKLYIVENN